ncbi:oligopeptide transport system permease protein oppC, partial [Vibrio parahaemolyticus V-223/04]
AERIGNCNGLFIAHGARLHHV